jgi:ABC-type spermidine/putrescine transport system permease subunit II
MAAFVLVAAGSAIPNGIRIVFTMPIMVPGVLIGIALLIFFSARLPREPVADDRHRRAARRHRPVRRADRRLAPAELRPQARMGRADLGASPRRTLRHVVLPLIAPAILAGA